MPKHTFSMIILQPVEHTMGNLMEFTEPVAIAYTEGEIKGLMWRGVHILCT